MQVRYAAEAFVAKPKVILSQTGESRPSNSRAMFLTPVAGLVAGLALSRSGFAAICFGAVLGFALGAVCSYIAVSRRVVFGIAGNVVAAVTALAISGARNYARPGVDTDVFVRQLPGMLVVLLVTLCVPGLLGSWAALAAKRPAA